MAKVTAGEPTGGGADASSSPPATGVVRFFDQYGLLGVAAVDPDSGIATLPYAFTSGGRRELRAEYSGCSTLGASRSTTTSVRIYSAAATITLDDVPSQPYARGKLTAPRTALTYPAAEPLPWIGAGVLWRLTSSGSGASLMCARRAATLNRRIGSI
jgi:hypothetical protein